MKFLLSIRRGDLFEDNQSANSTPATFLSHSFLSVLSFKYHRRWPHSFLSVLSFSLFAELEKCILVEIENSQVRMSGYPLCCKNEVSLGCRSKAWNVMTFYVCQVSHSCYSAFN